MAIFGTQLVISMLMACIIQRLPMTFSFARWLLGKQLLVYLPPNTETLKNAEGIKDDKKQKKKGSEPDYKISKNVDVPIEVVTIGADHLSELNFFAEYQWLMDFTAYTFILYVITETYLFIRPNVNEVNMSVVWCLLVIVFALNTLLSLTKIYFRSDETSSERSMCLVCGLIYLLVAMLILLVDEKWIEFELRDAYDSFKVAVTDFSQEISLESSGPTSELIFKLSLAAWGGFLGALFVFPGMRFAQMHRDLLNDESVGPLVKVLIHLNFISPLLTIMMWVTPVAREYFTQHKFSGLSKPILTPDQFESTRIIFLIGTCILRLWLTSRYMQSYLNIAYKKVADLRKEAGRIQISEYKRTISSVFNYSCVVALQYAAPTVLLLFCCLLLKTLGDYSWIGTVGTSPVQSNIAHLPFSLHRLKGLMTPALFRGMLNFIVWWISAIIFSNTVLGYAFYSYNDKV